MESVHVGHKQVFSRGRNLHTCFKTTSFPIKIKLVVNKIYSWKYEEICRLSCISCPGKFLCPSQPLSVQVLCTFIRVGRAVIYNAPSILVVGYRSSLNVYEELSYMGNGRNPVILLVLWVKLTLKLVKSRDYFFDSETVPVTNLTAL